MVSFEQLISALSDRRILVIGDVMLDRYLVGSVTRVSPEAPVPVLRVESQSAVPGGAANVAINLAAIGVKAELIGVVGDDEHYQCLKSILTYQGVHTSNMQVKASASTIVKTRVVARTQQICRIDLEGPRAQFLLEDRDSVTSAISRCNAVILSDYAKGVVTQELYDFLRSECTKAETILVVDPKPNHKLRFWNADLLTPNRREAFALAGLEDEEREVIPELSEVVSRIFDLHSPRLLLITLGPSGMALCRNGSIEAVIPTMAQAVFDVSGAGDTVVAFLTACLAANYDAMTAATVANAAAGVVVAKLGTATVARDELSEALNRQEQVKFC